MKFESAIFHLSITFQRDPLTTNRETLGEDVPIRDSPCDGALALVNQDISHGPPVCTGTRHRLTLFQEYFIPLLSVRLIIYILN